MDSLAFFLLALMAALAVLCGVMTTRRHRRVGSGDDAVAVGRPSRAKRPVEIIEDDMRRWSQWSSIMDPNVSTQALALWEDRGGRLDDAGEFHPPLPLGRELHREVFVEWATRRAADKGMRPASSLVAVRRTPEGAVQFLAGGLKPLVAEGDEGLREDAHDKFCRWWRLVELSQPTDDHGRFDRTRDAVQHLEQVWRTMTLAEYLHATGAVYEAWGDPDVSGYEYPAPPEQELEQRIREVDADFERRRFDICEVIEHHALFSMRFEPTRRFEQQRLMVRDTDLSALEPQQALRLVSELETLYAAAVAHAEHVGLDALRDPKLGTTAVKLARTAADTRARKTERANARTKLESALRELGLPVEPRALDALHPLALEAS